MLRFNFRGVGRSQGLFENGAGELSDAASALDWLQAYNKDAKICWIVGVSFGAWISMQLLMRRPEISGFISIAPLAKHYDFSFLAPCPSSGLFVNGDLDTVTPPEAAQNLVSKLKTQKGIVIEHKVLAGANHFFENKIDELVDHMRQLILIAASPRNFKPRDRRRPSWVAARGLSRESSAAVSCRDLTARYANASASIASPLKPKCSAG